VCGVRREIDRLALELLRVVGKSVPFEVLLENELAVPDDEDAVDVGGFFVFDPADQPDQELFLEPRLGETAGESPVGHQLGRREPGTAGSSGKNNVEN